MTEQIIRIEDIDIVFYPSKRAKHISISVRPIDGVRVAVPSRSSVKKARGVVLQKIDWIRASMTKMEAFETGYTVFDEHTVFKTRDHVLEISCYDTSAISTKVKAGIITVVVPNDSNVLEKANQMIIRGAIERAWRIEAKLYLPERVKQMALQHGFNFNRVSIRNSKTRWGSCSYNNNINLSLHLMRLPHHLIDYVILHELVHTKIKNHSIDFWNMLDDVSGNARGLDNEMKRYSTRVY